ncbi:glycoside hydrolase family protein [Reichenbachiella sp. MALMAid0571]|uniref:glycoside hydrolase family protein n=1 Tax=Reichenbachiella sp. MALMAid0571 TaxID=3143939 RepID=UPI0032DEFC5F
MKYALLLLFSLAVENTLAQTAGNGFSLTDRMVPVTDDNIFKSKGYHNWGTSVIKGEDGKYHLFYARWKEKYDYPGWLTRSEIAHATSDKPFGPWKFKEVVLTGRGGNNWDAITAHNPKIKYFEGKYYLYYIATNMGDNSFTNKELGIIGRTGRTHPDWEGLRSNQRTGVAVSNSLNGPWKRMDQPLIEPSGPITTLTVNPAIIQGKDGKYFLIVKGDKPNETGPKRVRDQAIAISDSPIGPFKMQKKPVIDYVDTEDISMWYDNNRDLFYAIFHAQGFIGLVSSTDGLHWDKAEHYVLMEKRINKGDGSILIPDRLERPFVFLENGIPTVLSFAATKDKGSFCVFVPLRPQD